jgi:transposase-like protein
MVETLEPEWWRQYRRGLEQTFAQDELVVRSQEIKRL